MALRSWRALVVATTLALVAGLAPGTAAAAGSGPSTGSSPALASTNGPGSYVPLTAQRVLDTRSGLGGRSVPAGRSLVLRLLGTGGLPTADVAAVVLNVTVTDPTGAGSLAVAPTAVAATSNVNFSARQTVANLVVADLATDGTTTFTNNSGGSVQVVADVSGYYRAGTPTLSGSYVPTQPGRLLDTRHAIGVLTTTPVPAHGTVVLDPATWRDWLPIPTDEGALTLNVTATAATGAGYLTVYGDGAPMPTASTLNFSRGQTVPALVEAKPGADHRVAIYNGSGGTVHVVVDVFGYTIGGAPVADGKTHIVAPTRLLDTRRGLGGSGPVAAGGSVTLHLVGNGVPQTGVTSATVNLTATDVTAPSYVVASPGGVPVPATSNLNLTAGVTAANLVKVPVGADGTVVLSVRGSGRMQLVADLEGYSTTGPPAPTTTWSTVGPALQTNISEVGGVTCATPAFCMVWDDRSNRYARFDGTRWSDTLQIDGATGPIYDISCPSTTFCAALVGAQLALYDGARWTISAPPPAAGLDTLSCVASGFCAAVSSYNWASTFADGAWSPAVRPHGSTGPRSVSCATSTFCVATDEAGQAVTYDGSSWSAAVMVLDGAYRSVVSCPEVGHCVAVGDTGYASSSVLDGGHWSTPVTVGQDSAAGQVSCATRTSCMTVTGTYGEVFDGDGSSWARSTTLSVPYLRTPGYATLIGVQCPTASWCVAVDLFGVAWTRTDGVWDQGTAALRTRNLPTDVSCASPSFCAAVDLGGHAATFDGASWSTPESLTPELALNAVSCPSSDFCLAVGTAGLTVTRQGGVWGPPVASPDTSSLVRLSCASASSCWAVDTAGSVMAYDGARWSTPGPVPFGDGSTSTATDVSCPTATTCVALLTDGRLAAWDGTSWSVQPVGSVQAYGSLSCPTTTFCAAVAGYGTSVEDGSRWTDPTFANGYDHTPSDLSCPTTTRCVALYVDGGTSAFSGAWSEPAASGVRSPTWTSPMRLSCPTVDWCLAVGPEQSAVGTVR